MNPRLPGSKPCTLNTILSLFIAGQSKRGRSHFLDFLVLGCIERVKEEQGAGVVVRLSGVPGSGDRSTRVIIIDVGT